MKKSFFKLTSVLLAVVIMLGAMLTIPVSAATTDKIYEHYTFTKDRYLPNNEGCAVTTLFVNDAIEASSDVSGLADGKGFSLAPNASNYLKFEYEATEAGMYSFAVQYYRKAYADCERCFDFAVDDMGQERVSVPGTNDIRWVVISVALEAGKHTFTLSSASGSVDTSFNPSATWLGDVNVYEFRVWMDPNRAPKTYRADIVTKDTLLNDLSAYNVVFNGYVNDAVDANALETVSAFADGAGYELTIGQNNYLTFTFVAPTNGEYSIAVEYYQKAFADCERCFDFSVDNMGRQRISVPGTSDRNFAVIPVTLEAGTHTFTVYSAAGGEKVDDYFSATATWCGPVNVYSFMVWTEKSTETGIDLNSTQERVNEESYDVRFVTLMPASWVNGVEKVGYDIVATGTDASGNPFTKNINLSTTKVYSAIYAAGVLTDAPDGYYYVTATITDISIEDYDNIDFDVTVYAQAMDGVTKLADNATVTYCDGVRV